MNNDKTLPRVMLVHSDGRFVTTICEEDDKKESLRMLQYGSLGYEIVECVPKMTGTALYRKVIKFGTSAICITLPHVWVKEQGLTPGSLVKLELRKDNITVSVEEIAMPKKQAFAEFGSKMERLRQQTKKKYGRGL